MRDLQAEFDAAVASSKTLTERPDNQTLLRLYFLLERVACLRAMAGGRR